MIISCPKCKTKYNVSADLISSGDKEFKCAVCGTIFSTKDNHKKKEKTSEISEIFETLREKKAEEKSSEEYFAEIDNSEQYSFSGKKSVANEVFNLIVFIILTIFVFLIGFLSVRYFADDINGQNFDQIYSRAKNSIKRAINYQKPSEKLAISIASDINLITEGSSKSISMNGLITNKTAEKQYVPPLLVRISDKDDNIIQEDDFFLDFNTMNPNEKRAFNLKIKLKSGEANHVEVNFN